jgi:hypothetical protein
MEEYEIFEPFNAMITVDLCGSPVEMPENNSILRGLQYRDMEGVSDGEFCWNGECLNCQVWLKNGDKEKAVMACRTDVREGMVIIRVSEELGSVLE